MNDSLLINGRSVSFDEIKTGDVSTNSEFEDSTISFCRQWLNEASSFSLKTSGSTGEPKLISVSREQMVASAGQTISFFKLSPEDTVLVCLNTAYIAGIMMLVRGMLSGAKIIVVDPVSNPLREIDQPVDFMAIVPLQLDQILEDPASLLKLEAIRSTIIGGAPVTYALQTKISKVKAKLWATFGMTETLTHFALRQLNPVKEESFKVLENSQIKTDDRGCLVVKSPVTLNKEVITNDRVKLIDRNKFIWLGRIDNIINSGGLKVQIEELERKTAVMLNDLKLGNSFFIGSLPDDTLSQKICLIVESHAEAETDLLGNVSFENYFSKYEIPKAIYYLQRFVYTPTGKINRSASMQLVNLLT